MNKLKAVLNIIKKFDAKDRNASWPDIENIVAEVVAANKPLTLISFTCSTINPRYMFNEKDPELYVSLNPQGNNLEPDLSKLQEIFLELSSYIEVRLIILIGNTDPFYIYTQETKALPSLSEADFWRRFSKRWRIYRKNLITYLCKQSPKLKVEVISWYELEKSWEKKKGWDFRRQFTKTRKSVTKYFSEEELNWELSNLKKNFGKGKYFYNLERPKEVTLKEWVKRKFAEYSVQGLWIKQIFPKAILLQNEKPSDLRTSMYQPLIKEVLNQNLPVIYPYGVDNLGFQ